MTDPPVCQTDGRTDGRTDGQTELRWRRRAKAVATFARKNWVMAFPTPSQQHNSTQRHPNNKILVAKMFHYKRENFFNHSKV